MTRDQLVPIIDRYNPFFTDHTWDNRSKTETARLDQGRLLVIRQVLAYGVNKTFTYPINDRTCICLVEKGEWGAKIRLETVKFILRENVKQPGIDPDLDDGWFDGR
mgnify:CR=1 FL=1